MKILALDTATKTGWALIANGKIVESGVQDFSKKRGESNGLMFLRFRKWLNDLIKSWSPELIAYERAHFRGGAATEIGVGLQTRVQELAASFGVESTPVHTGTLKKWATGKGNAGKDLMMKIAETHLDRPPIDDNEADAIMIGMWADHHFNIFPKGVMPIRPLRGCML